jgi:hypothetical protein
MCAQGIRPATRLESLMRQDQKEACAPRKSIRTTERLRFIGLLVADPVGQPNGWRRQRYNAFKTSTITPAPSESRHQSRSRHPRPNPSIDVPLRPNLPGDRTIKPGGPGNPGLLNNGVLKSRERRIGAFLGPLAQPWANHNEAEPRRFDGDARNGEHFDES